MHPHSLTFNRTPTFPFPAFHSNPILTSLQHHISFFLSFYFRAMVAMHACIAQHTHHRQFFFSHIVSFSCSSGWWPLCVTDGCIFIPSITGVCMSFPFNLFTSFLFPPSWLPPDLILRGHFACSVIPLLLCSEGDCLCSRPFCPILSSRLYCVQYIYEQKQNSKGQNPIVLDIKVQ